MANWLLKTEPSVYSITDFQRDKTTIWDGIKNNLALKHLKTVQKGDRCIIYHTGGERICVGLGTATSGAYPDPEKNDDCFLYLIAHHFGTRLGVPSSTSLFARRRKR